MTAPLTPGDLERLASVAEAALSGRWTVPPEDFAALLAHVRSLTERAKAAESRLSRARKALAEVAPLLDAITSRRAVMWAPGYPGEVLAKVRSALAEPPGGP